MDAEKTLCRYGTACLLILLGAAAVFFLASLGTLIYCIFCCVCGG